MIAAKISIGKNGASLRMTVIDKAIVRFSVRFVPPADRGRLDSSPARRRPKHRSL